jgi:integrase
LLSVSEAVGRFLRDKKTTLRPPDEIEESEAVLRFRAKFGKRDPEPEGVRKYRDVLKPLENFCNQRQIVFLQDVNTDLLTDFRETWKGRYDPETKGYKAKTQVGKKRYQESLKVFFRYALKNKWITEDPSAELTDIEVPDPDPQPYTEEEWNRILAQIEPTFPKIHGMVLAFVLVLKFAALRISDVVRLEKDHIKDLELRRRAKKNFQPVELRVTDELLMALNGFEHKSQRYFFWTGYGDWETAAKDWSGRILKLWRAASIEGGERRRSHAFRATLVDGVLSLPNGTMEDAQILLGHKRLTTTLHYYASLSKKRREKAKQRLKELREAESKSNAA